MKNYQDESDQIFRRRLNRALRREQIFQGSRLFNLDIEITTRCNLRCKTCYAAAPNENSVLTLEQFEIVMKKTKELVDHLKMDGVWLTVTGGEPMTVKELSDMLKVSRQYGVKGMSIITNGTLIDAGKARTLASLDVTEIMLSLDGASAETNDTIRGVGTFEKVMKAMQTLVNETNIFLGATLTLTGLNIDEVEDFVKLCFEQGLNYAWINPPVFTGRILDSNIGIGIGYKEHLKTMRLVKHLDIKYFKHAFGVYYNVPYYSLSDPISPYLDLNTACPWGRNNLTIKTDGSVLPCLYSRDLILGNVFKESLLALYDSQILRNFRDLSSLRGNCKGCKYTSFCCGCRARTYYLTGDWFAPDPWCPLNNGSSEEDMKIVVVQKYG